MSGGRFIALRADLTHGGIVPLWTRWRQAFSDVPIRLVSVQIVRQRDISDKPSEPADIAIEQFARR